MATLAFVIKMVYNKTIWRQLEVLELGSHFSVELKFHGTLYYNIQQFYVTYNQ